MARAEYKLIFGHLGLYLCCLYKINSILLRIIWISSNRVKTSHIYLRYIYAG